MAMAQEPYKPKAYQGTVDKARKVAAYLGPELENVFDTPNKDTALVLRYFVAEVYKKTNSYLAVETIRINMRDYFQDRFNCTNTRWQFIPGSDDDVLGSDPKTELGKWAGNPVYDSAFVDMMQDFKERSGSVLLDTQQHQENVDLPFGYEDMAKLMTYLEKPQTIAVMGKGRCLFFQAFASVGFTLWLTFDEILLLKRGHMNYDASRADSFTITVPFRHSGQCGDDSVTPSVASLGADSFRRGGALHRFLYAREKWPLKAICWWGGWTATSESMENIVKFLLDSDNSNDTRRAYDYGDMMSTTTTTLQSMDARHTSALVRQTLTLTKQESTLSRSENDGQDTKRELDDLKQVIESLRSENQDLRSDLNGLKDTVQALMATVLGSGTSSPPSIQEISTDSTMTDVAVARASVVEHGDHISHGNNRYLDNISYMAVDSPLRHVHFESTRQHGEQEHLAAVNSTRNENVHHTDDSHIGSYVHLDDYSHVENDSASLQTISAHEGNASVRESTTSDVGSPNDTVENSFFASDSRPADNSHSIDHDQLALNSHRCESSSQDQTMSAHTEELDVQRQHHLASTTTKSSILPALHRRPTEVTFSRHTKRFFRVPRVYRWNDAIDQWDIGLPALDIPPLRDWTAEMKIGSELVWEKRRKIADEYERLGKNPSTMARHYKSELGGEGFLDLVSRRLDGHASASPLLEHAEDDSFDKQDQRKEALTPLEGKTAVEQEREETRAINSQRPTPSDLQPSTVTNRAQPPTHRRVVHIPPIKHWRQGLVHWHEGDRETGMDPLKTIHVPELEAWQDRKIVAEELDRFQDEDAMQRLYGAGIDDLDMFLKMIRDVNQARLNNPEVTLEELRIILAVHCNDPVEENPPGDELRQSTTDKKQVQEQTPQQATTNSIASKLLLEDFPVAESLEQAIKQWYEGVPEQDLPPLVDWTDSMMSASLKEKWLACKLFVQDYMKRPTSECARMDEEYAQSVEHGQNQQQQHQEHQQQNEAPFRGETTIKNLPSGIHIRKHHALIAEPKRVSFDLPLTNHKQNEEEEEEEDDEKKEEDDQTDPIEGLSTTPIKLTATEGNNETHASIQSESESPEVQDGERVQKQMDTVPADAKVEAVVQTTDSPRTNGPLQLDIEQGDADGYSEDGGGSNDISGDGGSDGGSDSSSYSSSSRDSSLELFTPDAYNMVIDGGTEEPQKKRQRIMVPMEV
ncbi:hypothetical protein BG004_008401 [Podila humilis]|nr:hypothetical protein BG004_008401 [Podila humilis]